MKRLSLGVMSLFLILSSGTYAEESEFKAKLQEDLDGYISSIQGSCGIATKINWAGGKLGFNPRESEKPEWNAVSSLCSWGLDAFSQACAGNEAIKTALKGIKTFTCTKGKGTLAYKKKGGGIDIVIDPSFTKNNGAGQTEDLVGKIKKELDT